MPILPLEPFVFPADLFAGASELVSDGTVGDHAWYVAHTKPRAEKALARFLLSATIPFFLPLYKKQTTPSLREQTSFAPLFPGYLFLRGDPEARLRAFASKQMAGCLPVAEQGRLTTDLAAVYRLMDGQFPLAPAQRILPGTEVEVTDGPFAGMTGIMVRSGGQRRLIVRVRMINQGVSVELDQASVRPLTVDGAGERARLTLIRG